MRRNVKRKNHTFIAKLFDLNRKSRKLNVIFTINKIFNDSCAGVINNNI